MLQNNKILIIDDEKTICVGCQLVFQKQGCTVDMAMSGREGIDRASREDFDVVITDYKMPDVNGDEVVKEIKQKKPEQPIIMITGYAEILPEKQAKRLGVEDYITKPFNPDEIIGAVSRVLDRGTINKNALAEKIMLRDTFITNIENPVKRAAARLIFWMLCLFGLTVTFLLVTRIALLAVLILCAFFGYVPYIPSFLITEVVPVP